MRDVCIAGSRPRGVLPPSMVGWAPAHTKCEARHVVAGNVLVPASPASASGGVLQKENSSGSVGRRRRRGAAVLIGSNQTQRCAESCQDTQVHVQQGTYQEAIVQVLPGSASTSESWNGLLVKVAWTPGSMAARLLMPGAVEFAGAGAFLWSSAHAGCFRRKHRSVSACEPGLVR